MSVGSPTEIGEMVGLTANAVRAQAKRNVDFPKPVSMQGRCYLYDMDEVARWYRERDDGRAGVTERVAHLISNLSDVTLQEIRGDW